MMWKQGQEEESQCVNASGMMKTGVKNAEENTQCVDVTVLFIWRERFIIHAN